MSYKGRFLRVDLGQRGFSEVTFDETTLRRFVGGTGLGALLLYQEVPPGVAWFDPENRLVFANGPLGGTQVGGSANISVVTKGALTGGAACTQANGFFGAFLRFSGFDGLIIQGAANRPVYLYVHDGGAELRDASDLTGRDTWETGDLVRHELGKTEREIAIASIGPAGENMVKFAGILCDKGHSASHNGSGAVMGSKRLKAIAVERGRGRPSVNDPDKLRSLARALLAEVKANPAAREKYDWGTSRIISRAHELAFLPVRNYTANKFPEWPLFMGDRYRKLFELKRSPCWACQFHHCHLVKVTEGPYSGYFGEEPEYAQWAAWGPGIGVTDPGAALMLSNELDRLGMENNDAGFIASLVIECYEKGVLTLEDTDGLELSWGNAEAVRALLHKIANREGFGNRLADGIMAAAASIGGEAPKAAIHTMKGICPRSSDARGKWSEILDICCSNTGTMEVELGLSLWPENPFSVESVAQFNAKHNGKLQFIDTLGICKFNTLVDSTKLIEAVAASTGWDFTPEEALQVGRRIVNLLRVFNLEHGLTSDMEAPSFRMLMPPIEGPGRGITVAPSWWDLRRRYLELMGWDTEAGMPLPQTLKSLDLDDIVRGAERDG